MCNDTYIKTKIKIYNNRVYKNLILDSIFVHSDTEYYLQILLECKYAIENKKIVHTINEDLELIESDDE